VLAVRKIALLTCVAVLLLVAFVSLRAGPVRRTYTFGTTDKGQKVVIVKLYDYIKAGGKVPPGQLKKFYPGGTPTPKPEIQCFTQCGFYARNNVGGYLGQCDDCYGPAQSGRGCMCCFNQEIECYDCFDVGEMYCPH
jgi:hypothetical protein